MATDKVTIVFDEDHAGFMRGADQVENRLAQFAGKGLGLVKNSMFAAFSVEALRNFNAEFSNLVSNIEAARKASGANGKDLQVWEEQIGKIHGSLDDVVRLIEKLGIARDKALENPSGKEGKAFAALGIDRDKLMSADQAILFKEIQDHVGKTGSAIGSLGDLMDLLGEKSAKNLAIFADNFANTEDKMKRAGRLIDTELIERFKELTKLSKETDLGDALLGGKQGKAEALSSLQSAWVRFKSGLQLGTAVAQGLFGDKEGAQRNWRQVQDTQTRLTLQGEQSLFGGGLAEGSLTPAQYTELLNKTNDMAASREAQLKRIKDLQDTNTEKAKTDEQKLNDLYKQRLDLAEQMHKVENDRSKSTQWLTMLEDTLRLYPKIHELEEKQQKKQEESAKQEQQKFDRREEKVGDIMDRVGGELFSKTLQGDALTETGNFLGEARVRLQATSDAKAQTEILGQIRDILENIYDRKSNPNKDDFPDL